MFGMLFFSAPQLHEVPALRPLLLLYSRGFALPSFKIEWKSLILATWTASIYCHVVPEGQQCPCMPWPRNRRGRRGGEQR